jgi:pimeloyl-ACP methyl ester carboxylesterase
MRRILLGLLIALAALLAVNTVVMNRETKAAKADAGRIIDLPGGDLQVRESGPPEAPNIVLLHGFACSLGWWDNVTPALARDHHVIAFDLLGHGGSEKPRDGYAMEDQARRVSAALDKLGVRRAVVVGHSMGGAVATALTELRRQLVSSLVILDTGPDKGDGRLPLTARLGFVPVLGQAIRRVAPDSAVRNGLESAFAPGFDVPDAFVDDFRDMTYSSYDGSHDAVDDYREQSGLADRLADEQVPVPLLVIFGTEDDIADPESAQDYRKVPNARIELIEGAGHSPHVEKPAATARLIRSFIESSKS